MAEKLPVWMDPIELSQLLAAIASVAPRRFLEWGSGGSTRALLERFDCIAEYVAVEHDGRWVEQVRAAIRDPRLRLVHVAPDRPPPPGASRKIVEAWDEEAEFDRPRLEQYIAWPRSAGGLFDFVLVDGRARRFCIVEGFSLLRPGGVLAVHDAQRTEYHDAIRSVGRPVFLEPWKQGQICLVRKP